VSITGADYSYARPSVGTLNSLGVKFVSRYAGGDSGKQLTLSEAQQLTAAGIYIVCNFESSGRGGNYSQGVADAREADAHFASCGLSNAIIYFSIDFDETNPSAMDGYFQGINSVIGAARTDCYGNTALIRHLRAVGLIRAGQTGWRTMSTGWTGGAGSTSEFAIEQIWPPFNSSIDKDIAYVDFAQAGAYLVGNVKPPAPLPPSNTIQVSGVTVSQVQTRLNVWGAHLIVDGVEGPTTLQAIKDFQGSHGLVVDGIVGPMTWGALSLNPAPPAPVPAPAPSPAPAPVPAPNTDTYQYRASHNSYTPLTVDGQFGLHSIQALQWVIGVTPDGSFGSGSAKALQALLGVFPDGIIGQITVRTMQSKLGATPDGVWGPNTTKALQDHLNRGTFY